jgi:hypothetical protein
VSGAPVSPEPSINSAATASSDYLGIEVDDALAIADQVDV